MKKISSLSIALILSIFTFGQSAAQLDTKNGFKEIHLGDNLSKYSGQLSVLDARDNSYKYTGTCCQDVFGNDVEAILLKFTNNQLERITIIMPEGQGDIINKSNPKYLDSNFKLMFGEYSGLKADDTTGDLGSQWRGNKVMLSIEYKYRGYKTGWQAFIVVEGMGSVNSGF